MVVRDGECECGGRCRVQREVVASLVGRIGYTEAVAGAVAVAVPYRQLGVSCDPWCLLSVAFDKLIACCFF